MLILCPYMPSLLPGLFRYKASKWAMVIVSSPCNCYPGLQLQLPPSHAMHTYLCPPLPLHKSQSCPMSPVPMVYIYMKVHIPVGWVPYHVQAKSEPWRLSCLKLKSIILRRFSLILSKLFPSRTKVSHLSRVCLGACCTLLLYFLHR